MNEPNQSERPKDPADAICPALWRAKKAALKLAKDEDRGVGKKFGEVSEELDVVGMLVGCRFSSPRAREK